MYTFLRKFKCMVTYNDSLMFTAVQSTGKLEGHKKNDQCFQCWLCTSYIVFLFIVCCSVLDLCSYIQKNYDFIKCWCKSVSVNIEDLFKFFYVS